MGQLPRAGGVSMLGILATLACNDASTTTMPNVLLVSMDTVRYDRTSLGGDRDTTPNLARLASAGTSYSRAYSVGNESLYSHAALLSGKYPSEIAIPDYGSYSLPKSAATIGSVLAAYGYDTGGFTGGGHVNALFGFDNGFGTFQASSGDTRFGSFFDSVPRARTWIAAREKPWFAFVHGYDAHSPYVQRGPFHHPWGATGASALIEALVADPLAVEQLRGRRFFPDRTPQDFVHAAGRTVLGTDFYTLPAEPTEGERSVELTDAEVRHLRDHYDSGLLYGDFWLGELLTGIDLRTTLVIVVADHGEDLLDHGYMNHRAGLWDSTLHVPLVVAGPGFEHRGVRSELVDLRRVLPTILAAVGATLPDGVVAKPLQEGGGEAVVYAEGVMDMVSATDGVSRLTLRDVQLAAGAPGLAGRGLFDGKAEFYETAAGQEALAGATLSPTAATAAERLRQSIGAWRGTVRTAPDTGVPVSAEVRAALREKGYWSPEAVATPGE